MANADLKTNATSLSLGTYIWIFVLLILFFYMKPLSRLSRLKSGLGIRSIFGRIRIQQIRILNTGSGSYLYSPRINSNSYIFFISIRFVQIFSCTYVDFFSQKKWKNSPENVHFIKFCSRSRFRIRPKRSGSGSATLLKIIRKFVISPRN